MSQSARMQGNADNNVQRKGYGFRKQKVERAADFLPDPETLEAYDYVIEGSAKVILGMIEREQQHRHQLEVRALSIQSAGLYFGQVLAGLIAGALVLAITMLGLNNQVELAVLLAILGIGGMTAAFVKGREAVAARTASYRRTRPGGDEEPSSPKASNQP